MRRYFKYYYDTLIAVAARSKEATQQYHAPPAAVRFRRSPPAGTNLDLPDPEVSGQPCGCFLEEAALFVESCNIWVKGDREEKIARHMTGVRSRGADRLF